MKRLLVTGGSGNLGKVTARLAEAQWQVWSTYFNNAHVGGGEPTQIDLRKRDETTRLVDSIRPDVIIHTAASDRSPDMENTNRLAAANILAAAANTGARLIALSSDLIFNGDNPPYREDSPPAPKSAYGEVKAENDRGYLSYDRALVIRTSLIYDTDPDNNQMRWLRSAVESGQELKLFADEIRQPISATDLSLALLELAEGDRNGILNVAGPERMSRWDYGCALLMHLGYDPASVATRALAAEIAPGRPRDVSLDLSAANTILKTRIKPLREVLGLKAAPPA